MMKNIDPYILSRANQWLDGNYDAETKDAIRYLIERDTDELTDAFYRDLEFGTGGLRGVMGAGTNRMNKYTVGMATQGLANYLLMMFPGLNEIKIAIAHDSRNNSRFFAQIAANVLSANGCTVFLFDDLRPTPELSFSIRHLGCQSGIVITASHNPKEYNGYKVYWDDGGQLVPPHDKNAINEVQKITSVDKVKWEGVHDRIISIGKEIDAVYLQKIKGLSLSPEAIEKHKDLKIVYTPIHGSGVNLVPQSLKNFGFQNVSTVQAQCIPDGNFPTVKSPNPEEHAAMSMAIEQAQELDADLVLATDPDADRVGVAIRDNHNQFILLNGNQTASLLIYYLLNQWNAKGKIKGKEFIVKTIVTSELLKNIADQYKVACFDVLTGFKYIAEIIRKHEGELTFIGGGEESYGYLVGDFVRDKDAVISCSMIAETAAWAASQGITLYELLLTIYHQFGFYKESLLSVTKKGKAGAEEIQQMMLGYRTTPPVKIHNIDVVMIKDYLKGTETNLEKGYEQPLGLPKADVIQFFLADGSKITVRPSGTEPKIKFYFGAKGELKDKHQFAETDALLDEKLKGIIASMKLG